MSHLLYYTTVWVIIQSKGRKKLHVEKNTHKKSSNQNNNYSLWHNCYDMNIQFQF